MMKRRSPARHLVIAIAVALLLAHAPACGDNGGDDAAPTAAPSLIPVVSPTAAASPAAAVCDPARTGAGETTRTILHDGLERSYLLHLPDGYDGTRPAPLVLAMHGLGGSAESLSDVSALGVAADERGVIIAFPQGTGEQAAWNVDDVPAGPNDVGFLSALIDELSLMLCIDATRVYAAGFSNGGGMAQKLACAEADRIAAIALVAATYLDCSTGVPLIAFHGAEDQAAPYRGGEVRPGVTLPPVADAIKAWAAAVGCAEPPAIASPSTEVNVAVYDGCPSGRADVQLYVVLQGGHTWPGSSVELPGVGITTQAIDASALMLDFFADYSTPRPD